MRPSLPDPLILVLLLACALLSGCSPLQLQVEPGADFEAAGYRSVAWATAPLGERSSAEMRRFDGAVRQVAEAELAQRGYRLAAPAEADLLLDYRISARAEVAGAGALSPTDAAERAWDLDPTPAGDTALYRHPVALEQQRGELFLSLRDRRSGDLVWQGRAAGVGGSDDPGDERELARRAVVQLLRQLPAAQP